MEGLCFHDRPQAAFNPHIVAQKRSMANTAAEVVYNHVNTDPDIWMMQRKSPGCSLVASKHTTQKGLSALSIIYCLCTLWSIINVHCVAKFMCCLCPPHHHPPHTHPYYIKAQGRLELREHWVTSWKTAMIM